MSGLHNLEQRINNIPEINALYVRAGYFMENLLSQIPNILNSGETKGLFDKNLKFPMICTKDIGNFIGEAMLKFNYKGKNIKELHGSVDLNMNEATGIIKDSINMPNLKYREITEEEDRETMCNNGFSEHIIDVIIETTKALNNQHINMVEQRTQENTTPTTYKNFIEDVFIPLYKEEKNNL